MHMQVSDRGFRSLVHAASLEDAPDVRVVGESSAINLVYEEAPPGSSYLWLGQYHHLDRSQVAELVAALQHWLAHGRLPESTLTEKE